MKMSDRMNGLGAAVATVVVPIALSKGFGWYTGDQPKAVAPQESNAAVVKVLLPVWVAKFQKRPDSATRLVELKKISSSWARESFIRENKWAASGIEQNSGVIDACAEALYKL